MIKFTKMHGLGNDYVYINCTKKDGQKIDNIVNLAQFVSNRHFGVGSDGLILIEDSNKADFRMRMFNYDGSEAEMCGNGIRCVGKFVYDKGLTNKTSIKIETLAGIKNLTLQIKKEKVENVCVDMGEPILEPDKIPVVGEQKLTLQVEGKEFLCTNVSMGNPHTVTFIKEVENFAVEKYGSKIEVEEHFPNKVNVEFAQMIDDTHIKMRVWERGSGETMACGTGACATLVAAVLNGYTKRKVELALLGGKLEIFWNEEDNHVYMTGPAVTVFEGVLEESEEKKW